MNEFKIKQNDTLPYLKYQVLNDIDGTKYQFDGDEEVKFFLRNENGVAIPLTGTASILDALTGKLQYIFTTVDTANPGFFEGEFQVTKSGNILTIPQDRSLFIRIYDDIAD